MSASSLTTVLLVEDDDDDAFIFARAAQAKGLKVIRAMTTGEGILFYRLFKPEILAMYVDGDLKEGGLNQIPPRADTIPLIQEAAAEKIVSCIISTTTRLEEGYAEEMMAAGCTHHLAKPTSADEWPLLFDLLSTSCRQTRALVGA